MSEEPVTLDGRRVARVGSNAFAMADVAPLVAGRAGTPCLRISALDYGAVGYVSDVFLLVE